MHTMQVVNLEDVDYPWDEFTERENCFNGAYIFVALNSEYTPRSLREALKKAGITENTCDDCYHSFIWYLI